MNNNFTNILTQQAQKQPKAIALILEDETISYELLEGLVSKCATYLNQQGVKEGDVVAELFDNGLLSVITMLASARMGATLFTISETMPKDFLNQIIEDINASFIISDFEKNNTTNLKYIYMQKKFFEDIEINTSLYASNPKAPWYIIVGSGSTGKKKLILDFHKEFIFGLTVIKNHLPIDIHDRITSFIPLSYATTKGRFFETITAGATFVVLPDLNGPIIDTLKKYRVTTLHASVFHIEKLLNSLPSNVTQVLGFLKILSVGYSSVKEPLRQRIKNKLTKNLFIRYSTNEIGPISLTSLENVFSTPTSVGKPIKGVKVEIVDYEGKLKPANEVGLIRIQSPGMADGYLNDEEATNKAFKDGWFYPGDIGKLTEDGQLIHLGRSDDMMIMNGVNIYPSQIENEMLKHSEVNEAIAFPLKHEVHQDIPVCAVVLKKNSKIIQNELTRYAYDNLGSYRPQLVIILDKSPRNEQGKIIKKELQHLVKTSLNRNKM